MTRTRLEEMLIVLGRNTLAELDAITADNLRTFQLSQLVKAEEDESKKKGPFVISHSRIQINC